MTTATTARKIRYRTNSAGRLAHRRRPGGMPAPVMPVMVPTWDNYLQFAATAECAWDQYLEPVLRRPEELDQLRAAAHAATARAVTELRLLSGYGQAAASDAAESAEEDE